MVDFGAMTETMHRIGCALTSFCHQMKTRCTPVTSRQLQQRESRLEMNEVLYVFPLRTKDCVVYLQHLRQRGVENDEGDIKIYIVAELQRPADTFQATARTFWPSYGSYYQARIRLGSDRAYDLQLS